MKIIITGNKGFVGSNLTKYLTQKNKKILGVSRNPINDEISYDELKPLHLDSSQALVHLAGKAHDTQKTFKRHEYFDVNTSLTKKLFEMFLQSKSEIFIYLSSVKAVTDVVHGELLENEIPRPNSLYGKSKLAAENYILSKKLPNNKRVFIIRPCLIYGPNPKGNLKSLFDIIKSGLPWFFGSYKNKRSYCSVENLSFVIEKLLDNKNINSNIFNISDDEPLSTNDVVRIIYKAINKKPIFINLPIFILEMISRIGDVIPLKLNSDKLSKLTESYIVNNNKVKKTIKSSLPVNARDGLYESFKSIV